MKTEKTAETNKVGEPRKQKISVTYTLRSFRENIKKLKKLELITEEEETELINIYIKALEKHIIG